MQKLRISFQPTENWGPKNPENKSAWLDYKKQDIPFQWTPKFKCLKKQKSTPGNNLLNLFKTG